MARVNEVSRVGSDHPALARLVERVLEAERNDPELARRSEVRRRVIAAMMGAERITSAMLRRRYGV